MSACNGRGAKGTAHPGWLVGSTGRKARRRSVSQPELLDKPFAISKQAVVEAFRKVRANQGGPGVDGCTIEEFESDLRNRLYVTWNRMSSGSYFPPPVKAVAVPKLHGDGVRMLGVPTVADRVAQTVVAMELEKVVEPKFHPSSYGYRPGRSALDAVEACRARCFTHSWVLDCDIAGFFDNVSHDLIVKAVEANTDLKWVVLYVQRWLTAPIQREDGTLARRDRGTPQGSAISPLLANLFLHYAFDRWMVREFPGLPFERYCDDIVVHCVSESREEAVADSFPTPGRALAEGIAQEPPWSCPDAPGVRPRPAGQRSAFPICSADRTRTPRSCTHPPPARPGSPALS